MPPSPGPASTWLATDLSRALYVLLVWLSAALTKQFAVTAGEQVQQTPQPAGAQLGNDTSSLLIQYAPIEFVTLPLGYSASRFTQFLARWGPANPAAGTKQ